MCEQEQRHDDRARLQRSLMPVLVLTVLATGFGCAEQPTMILIRGAAAVGSDCVAPADPSTWRTEGVLDKTINTDGYILALNVENVAPSSDEVGTSTTGGGQGSKGAVFTNLAMEGNRVLITDVSVSIKDAAGAELDSFDLPLGGFTLDPAGGKATFPISVVPSGSVPAMPNGIILVHIKFSGITSSDTAVESNEFTFPITVCDGCLNQPCGTTQANTCLRPGQDVPFCPGTTG